MKTNTELGAIPHNPTTGNEYRGGNIAELLGAADEAGYPTAQWAGYGQWQGAGRQVRKGESSTSITYWMPKIDKKTKKPVLKGDGSPVLIPRVLNVFNVAQTDEMNEEQIEAAKARKAERAAKKAAKKSAPKKRRAKKSKRAA